MNVMILAAGEGTRLRPYTSVMPKPAIPFMTVPLAAHSLSFLCNQKINNLVVNTFHLPEQIHSLFKSLPHQAQNLYFSDEKGTILDSGGGIGKARQHFLGGGDFIAMNADEIILPKDPDILEKAIAHHRKTDALVTLMVMDQVGIGTKFGGVWCNAQNKILGFGKSPILGSQKAWHFVGAQILSERIFDYIPKDTPSNILYDAVTNAIHKGELVQAYPFECNWFETGNIADFLAASSDCFKFLASSKPDFQSRKLLQTLEAYGQGDLKIENTGAAQIVRSNGVSIHASADLKGLVVLGNGSSVEEGCRLKNCIVASGVTVKAHTEATDMIFL